jgi:putative flippase GtrA
MLLYIVSGTTNVLLNELFLNILPDTEIIISLRNNALNTIDSLSGFKLHKFGAFVLATLLGMVVNFLGQKLWLFKED